MGCTIESKPHLSPVWPTIGKLCAGFGISALLLTFCQAPWNMAWMAWIALVPFGLICRRQMPTKPLLISAYLVSFAYWLFAIYWLIPITGPGYVCFAAFQALYWPLLALGMHALRARNWPMTLAIPILFVGAESIQSFLFTGFSFYFLAHSQYQNTTLIQSADLFGTFGISVLIAAFNGLLLDMIDASKNRSLKSKAVFTAAVVVIVCIGLNHLYGMVRYGEIKKTTRTAGPAIASVQTNVPSAVKEETENAQDLLDGLFKLTNHCLAAGAKLIIWPETMVLSPLNPGYRMYCDPNTEPVRFNQQIEAYTKKNQCSIMVGAHGCDVGDVNGTLDVTNRYNSAYLYTPDGQSTLRFDKIHLVPFGEFIPFKKSFPPLYRLFMLLNPYGYDYNLTPGEHLTLFPIRLDNQEYRFGVLICYEDTDPAISRKLVFQNGIKKADWLVNMSNDGWYVQFEDNNIVPSVELAQRTAISVFRCIENRISLIRSVNTGISCLIDPSGGLRNGFQSGSLPDPVMERQAVEGWFMDSIPQCKTITFYSRYGAWIDKAPAAVLLLVILIRFAHKRTRRTTK